MSSYYKSFNPGRLILARHRRGMTKAMLADAVGLSSKSISLHENGQQAPSNGTIQSLASVLRFPVDFFFGDDPEQLSPDAVSFRSLSKMTASQRDMALSAGSLALMLSNWLEDRFEIPKATIPDLSQETDPEAAAISLRREWNYGELSIANMVHLLESKGIRVFSVAVDSLEVDAFSMWKGDTPFVFLNTMKSAERSRFDAAHELGHLVLHRHALDRSKAAEQAANLFASAFLMPRGSVLASAPRYPTLSPLIRLKKSWNVSVAALANRMHALEILTDWQYRRLSIEIAQAGFRREEPDPSPRETSQILDQAMRLLREEGRGKSDIARDLQLPTLELDNIMFGLTLVSLKGSGASPNNQKSSRHLSIVENG